MKIISNFKDYYDHIQGVMYDGDMVYIRKSKISKSPLSAPIFSNYNCSLTILGFCDNIIPCIVFTNCENKCKYTDNVIKYLYKYKSQWIKRKGSQFKDTFVSYDIQEFDKLVNKKRTYFGLYSIDRVNEYIEKIKKLNIFDTYQTPIFSIGWEHCLDTPHSSLTINTAPILKDYNFQSQYDPYTAYQELVMWIGNKAVSEYPPQIVDDIVLRDSKGFDDKSFKKSPTKKR